MKDGSECVEDLVRLLKFLYVFIYVPVVGV